MKKDKKKQKKREKMNARLSQAYLEGQIDGVVSAVLQLYCNNEDCDCECACDSCCCETDREDIEIKKVVFVDKDTFVTWNDGTTTKVTCHVDDNYSPYDGLVNAICKKVLANNEDGFSRKVGAMLNTASYYGTAEAYKPSKKEN